MDRQRLTRVSSFVLFVALLAPSCANRRDPEPAEIQDRLTVGTVQREISIGLDGASVVEILGSPNIVTTDEKRREVWVYDKVSSDRVDTARSTYATLIIIGGGSGTSSSSSRQRTLTVIIKFDEAKKVRDFAYNYTQF
jgi:hypothetical protein